MPQPLPSSDACAPARGNDVPPSDASALARGSDVFSSDACALVRGNDVLPSGAPAGPRSAGWLVRALALPIRAYRFLISPMLPPSCRFYPSCSEYALEALSRHGALRGGLLAAGRICRCHPWNPGGVDPVPESLSPLRVRAGRWPAALRGEPPVKAD